MKYFFILGANPTLSLAELVSVFNDDQLSLIQKNIAILETEHKIIPDIIKRIGGTIKFGLIHDELTANQAQDIIKALAAFLPSAKPAGKFYFGISLYGKAKVHPVKLRPAQILPKAKLFDRVNIKILAMEFKKLLKQTGINSRWVISREPTLSSVVAEQNKLTTNRGVEIIIIPFNKKLLLGRTLAVQPFKQLSFRDYGRPARDDLSGMLPPKLAQIMLNLAITPPLTKGLVPTVASGVGGILTPSPYQGEGGGEVILDPFCGSGTIITEAALMGYKNLIGSDISEKALNDTKKNISWIQKSYELRDVSYELFHSDASQLSKHITPHSIDAIITEPYLGPQRGKIDFEKVKRELEKLYSDSLREFAKILKPAGRIVMIWPVFLATHNSQLITQNVNPNLNDFTIINPFPAKLQKNIFIKLTPRDTIIYGRANQKVWREIVILEKS